MIINKPIWLQRDKERGKHAENGGQIMSVSANLYLLVFSLPKTKFFLRSKLFAFPLDAHTHLCYL